ncbi:MAG: hypothetical protein J0H01_37520 [Rhizobiales bacterium]|nr:hypothetical protein [Hyphomicrobiales bacterium]
MRLAVAELEEVHGIAKAVAPEPLCAQDWIGEGHRQRRSLTPEIPAFPSGVAFDHDKRPNVSLVLFQRRSPALQALAAGQRPDAVSERNNIGSQSDFNQGRIFHRNLRWVAPQ